MEPYFFKAFKKCERVIQELVLRKTEEMAPMLAF
jgi:hypothetical protein